MTTLTVNVRERFTNLRKKLDQLGYLQPLSLDSLPLVESIFTDLLWTTENLRKNKSELDSKIEVRERLEDYIEPYKRDNGRVLAENTRLQKKILEMRVEHDEVTRDLNCRVRQLEDEKEDLTVFSEQCLNKIKKYEVEAKQMVDKIVQLQEKNMQAIVHTSDGRSKPIGFRRQRMDIDHFIPRRNSTETGICSKCCESLDLPVITPADTGEGTTNSNSNSNSNSNDIIDCLTDKCHQLTKQLQYAQEEIELNDRKIDNYQVQLKLYEEEMNRLCQQLHGGRSLEAMSKEQDNKIKEKLIEQLNMQLDLLQQRNEELEKEICRINAINIKEGKNNMGFVSRKESTESQISELECYNKKLQKQIEKLVEKEKKLLEQLNCTTKKQIEEYENSDCIPIITENLQREICSLQSHIKNIEADRDYWRKEANGTDKVKLSSQLNMKRNWTESSEIPTRLHTPPVHDEGALKDESSYNKLYSELSNVKKERNNLQELLNKFERQLHDIQGNIRVLTQERDTINERYVQAQKELHEVRTALVQSESSHQQHGKSTPTSSQILLRRLETERNEAIDDLHKMTTERDSLRQQLHTAIQTNLTEKSRLKQNIDENEEEITKSRDKIKQLREKLGEIEEYNRELKMKRDDLEEIVAENRGQLQELNEQINGYDMKLRELTKNNSQLHQQLTETEQRVIKLQQNSQEKSTFIQMKDEEISKLKGIISELDQEKDQIQNEADQKSEQNNDLQHKLDNKQQALDDVHTKMLTLESQLRRIQDINNHRDEEMRASVIQNEQLEHEMRRITTISDEQRVEIAHYEEKLTTYTRENKRLESELRETRRYFEEVQEELRAANKNLEQSHRFGIEQQEQKEEIVEQYRQLSLEKEKCQLQIEQHENRIEQLEIEIEGREKIASNLREQLLHSEHEIAELHNQIQLHDSQLQQLNCALGSNQQILESHDLEKTEILQELAAMRDLCSRLENGKDQLQRQLSSRMLDLEQQKAENCELCRELESAKREIEQLQESVRNMETLMHVGREKEYRDQLESHERVSRMESELEQLRQQKQKSEHLSKQLSESNCRISELETELDRVKRSLTSEKFKLEMANQELKRFRSNNIHNSGISTTEQEQLSTRRQKDYSSTSSGIHTGRSIGSTMSAGTGISLPTVANQRPSSSMATSYQQCQQESIPKDSNIQQPTITSSIVTAIPVVNSNNDSVTCNQSDNDDSEL